MDIHSKRLLLYLPIAKRLEVCYTFYDYGTNKRLDDLMKNMPDIYQGHICK